MARRLKDVLSRKVLREVRRGLKDLGPVHAAWKAAVPPEFAEAARVLSWRRRELTIAVEGSPALSELAGFYKDAILQRLNRELSAAGEPTARSVRFVLEDEVGQES